MMYVCSRIHFGSKLNPSETGPRKNPGSLSEELGVQGGGLTGSGPKTRREPEYPMESLEAHRTEVGIELPTLEVGGKHCVPPRSYETHPCLSGFTSIGFL